MLLTQATSTNEWPVIGHERAVRILRRSISSSSVSHAYLFTGPEGVGKRTLALSFAMALNCLGVSLASNEGAEVPCGLCSSCARIAHGSHPDVIEMNLDIQAQALGDVGSKNKSGPAKELKIDTIRDMLSGVGLKPYSGRWKVYIIGDADRLSEEASNCLLKTLEEPPENSVLILLASDDSTMLSTIVSRCQPVPLHPIPTADVERALVDHWDAASDSARRISPLAAGRLGYAVRLLQSPEALTARGKALEEVALLSKATIVDRIASATRYAKAFTEARPELYAMLDAWESWWRDIVVVKAGRPELALNADQVSALASAADRLSLEQASGALQLISATRQRLRENVNPRLALEGLTLGLP